MNKKRIVFIPYKLHWRHILFSIDKQLPVTVLLPPEKVLPEGTRVHGVRIKYLEFGANFLKKLVKTEVRTLKYIKGLSNILGGMEIDTLVTYEFYHWYTFQCIYHKKKHPDVKLYLVSETKIWPKNIFANIIKRILFYYFRLNSKYIDGIFVHTETALAFTKKYLPKANITLLPTPIDTEVFKPGGERKFCRNKELSILMNARFSPYKRYDDLFDAIAILIKEGKKINLTCISRYKHDRKGLNDLVKEKNLEGIVNIIDSLPSAEMPGLYRSHDVLVLPSYNEAIGLVVPEAMACGTPTITSDTVGANVYVKDKETGFIFKTGDIKGLADCIRDCFDADLLEKFSKNAIKHINTNFTPEVSTETFKQAIRYES